VAAFHNGPGLNREVLAARFEGTAIAASDLGGVMLATSTVRADRAIRPTGGLKPSPCSGFIVETGFFENIHGQTSNLAEY
jgi:hypothetical protein